jgi:hypothetical protein
LEDTDITDLTEDFHAGVVFPLLLTQTLKPKHVVYISSSAALRPILGLGAHSIVKSAAEKLFLVWAAEQEQKNSVKLDIIQCGSFKGGDIQLVSTSLIDLYDKIQEHSSTLEAYEIADKIVDIIKDNTNTVIYHQLDPNTQAFAKTLYVDPTGSNAFKSLINTKPNKEISNEELEKKLELAKIHCCWNYLMEENECKSDGSSNMYGSCMECKKNYCYDCEEAGGIRCQIFMCNICTRQPVNGTAGDRHYINKLYRVCKQCHDSGDVQCKLVIKPVWTHYMDEDNPEFYEARCSEHPFPKGTGKFFCE